jgi:hypothetical protein
MLNTWLARIAFSAIACAGLGQAALLPIGSISFNQIGDSGEFGEFRIYNRTATPGYPVLTPVTFSNVSLHIDILGGLADQSLQIASLMAPQGGAYDSDDIYKSVNMTRAVLNATLSPGTAWQIAGMGGFTPQQPQLTMILLPDVGATLTRGSTWDILLNTPDGLVTPEPSTIFMGAAGILGLGLLRRRRTS